MDFYKRMRLVCEKIPEGRVVTYGQIALLCGMPGHARQVGYGLKWERAGDVPAHRVVNASGVLSGASAFEYPLQQKLLLEKEGIEVTGSPEGGSFGIGSRGKGWRVDLKKYQWQNTLEEAQELRGIFERKGI